MADNDEMDAELAGLQAEVGSQRTPQLQPSLASGLRTVGKGISVIVWAVLIIVAAITVIATIITTGFQPGG